jgi:hypothetical protein
MASGDIVYQHLKSQIVDPLKKYDIIIKEH